MSLKAEPMDYELDEDMFRMRSYTHSIIPKSFDLTDDQKAMRIPSPDEPYITGIFHRGSNSNNSQQQFGGGIDRMVPSDVAAMQQGGYYRQDEVKREQEVIDEEYATYTIARSEMELNSRLLPKKYKCKFCVYKTSYKSDLNRHLRRHAKKDNVYNCDVCNLPFRSVSKVYSHRQQCHMEIEPKRNDDLSLSCTMCSFRCAETDIKLYQLHVQKHIEENTCKICSKTLNSPRAVEKHKKIYHQVTNEVVFPPQAMRSVDMQYIPEINRSGIATSSKNILDNESDHSPAGCSSASSSRDGSNNSTPVPFGLSQFKGNNSKTYFVETEEREVIETPKKYKDFNKSSIVKTGNDLSDKSVQKTKNLADVKSPEKVPANIPTKKIEAPPPSAFVSKPAPQSREQKQSYKCEKCFEVFHEMKELFIHMSVCLQEEVFTKAVASFNCPICYFTSNMLEMFVSHMIKHTVSRYSCDLCNKPFANFRNILEHKRKVHKIDMCRRRSPGKYKYFGKGHSVKSSQISPSAKQTVASPYSKETIGSIRKMAEEDFEREIHPIGEQNGEDLNRVNKKVKLSTSSQEKITLNSATNVPKDELASGRYAKLVSNFDDFMSKPFACSLCFYRTNDLENLRLHVQGHITSTVGENVNNNVTINFDPISPEKSKIESKDRIFNVSMTTDSANQSSVIIRSDDDVMETGSMTNRIETQNYNKQLEKLERLLKNSKKSNKYFVSRALKRKRSTAKPHACDVCNKEFSMRILAKRHMDKIHHANKVA